MEITEFIKNFVEALELDESVEIVESTKFHELEEWDSLAALSTISFIDDVYNVTITNKDLKSASTIGDLLSIIESYK